MIEDTVKKILTSHSFIKTSKTKRKKNIIHHTENQNI